MKKNLMRAALSLLASALLTLSFPACEAQASYVNTNLNTYVHDATEMQIGYAGQDMQFRVRVGYNNVNGMYNPKTDYISDVIVRLSNDQNYLRQDDDPGSGGESTKNPYDKEEEGDLYDAWRDGRKAGIDRVYGGNLTYPIDSGRYPFEINASTFAEETRFERLEVGQYEEVVFHVKVRADTPEGYFGIPVSFYYNVPPNFYPEYKTPMKVEYINVFIKKAGDVSAPSTLSSDGAFVVGEGQSTPAGTAPNVMEYGVAFRNRQQYPLYEVNVHIEPKLAEGYQLQPTARAKSSAVSGYPFHINDGNYDRIFSAVQPDETVTAAYSMAIMANAASGFYPLSYAVSYKLTPDAPLTYTEHYMSYVRIMNPSMEDDSDDLGEFNQNDREKARLIVDSFRTEPEKVFAGKPFELILNLKNASSTISASNILVSFESEKADNSSVFTAEGGANSLVINSLKSGDVKELRMRFDVRPGVDPRSYAITLNEKYDSPDFKNAEEKITLDIPVNQVARLSVSNFELLPEAITVGGESNVMFNVNNTGKVMLYNVEAVFEADSVRKTSAYLGNIKPGETGNVDVMLAGVAPTADDGTIPIHINYEDVNGNVFTEEQSCMLYVSDVPDMEDIPVPEEPAPAEKPFGRVLPLLGLAAAAAAGVIVWRKRKKKDPEENA